MFVVFLYSCINIIKLCVIKYGDLLCKFALLRAYQPV